MSRKMKALVIILSVLGVAGASTAGILTHPCFGRRMSKERKARIEQSPNYRNGKFQNEIPTPQFTGEKGGFSTLWKFATGRPEDRVPSEPVEVVKTDLNSLPADRDWLVWFGHSSYLFCLDGKRYLVDPVLKLEWPVTTMMRPFKGTDIYTPEEMPDIDMLIITHEHWDHLDYATLRDIRHKVKQVVCPLGVAEYLEYWGYDPEHIAEMDWYETFSCQDSKTTCLPTRHFSNRVFKSNQTLWASFMVEAGGRKVYVGGDGGYDHRFKYIQEHYGSVDLALMENGQYNQDWANIHLMPEDLEKAILDLQAKQVFTVHHDKFALAKHAWTEPDSVAHDIAQRHHITLLDRPIGTVVYY